MEPRTVAVADEAVPEDLASSLKVLSNPLRIELLDRLRIPHPINDLRVRVRRREGDQRPSRIAAKQTIRAHVEALVGAGLVERVGVEGPVRYAVRASRLYSLVEELRRLSTQYVGHGVEIDQTQAALDARPPPRVNGPRLVLVHGVLEGKAFALDHADEWGIGRAGPDIRLDYDPYMSAHHASVRRKGRTFLLRDLESSNGTWLNWRRLDSEEVRLVPGDVIGVGRSLLVHQV